jgi:hypothetical protein
MSCTETYPKEKRIVTRDRYCHDAPVNDVLVNSTVVTGDVRLRTLLNIDVFRVIRVNPRPSLLFRTSVL